MEYDEIDARLAGETSAVTTVLMLLLRKLREDGAVDAAWVASTRAACLTAVAQAGRGASKPTSDVMLDGALATVASVFGPAHDPGV